ncbi:MAG TPA: hypothetical protein PKA44_08860, partial [Saprospiraceae bacterium]|nr:hypothetical protein [Saprospiraceae bacterium]HQU96890.1 hypothetical protein [Saprospiraceae bacterium]HQW96404.1 hypothetical protein [Saprospiraceae bacterium]
MHVTSVLTLEGSARHTSSSFLPKWEVYVTPLPHYYPSGKYMPHFSSIFTQEGNALHSSHLFLSEMEMYDTPLHSPYSKGIGRAAHAALPLQSKLTNHFGISA